MTTQVIFSLLLQTLSVPGETRTDWFLYVLVLALGGLFAYYANSQKATIKMIEENFEKALESQEKQHIQSIEAIKAAYDKLLELHSATLAAQMKTATSIETLTQEIHSLVK